MFRTPVKISAFLKKGRVDFHLLIDDDFNPISKILYLANIYNMVERIISNLDAYYRKRLSHEIVQIINCPLDDFTGN